MTALARVSLEIARFKAVPPDVIKSRWAPETE
jgi:hypothetical protein